MTTARLTRHHTIRPATDADRDLIGRLSSLDSRRPIEGPALIGEIDGIAVAVLSLTDGTVVANPFRRTADLVDVMRIRARCLRAVDPNRSRVRRMLDAFRRPRSIYAGV